MKSMRGHNEPYYGTNIEHVTGRLEAVDERDLYASAHCYLQPSRGEGFGLQPLQAIALGRPTILTNAHGHAAYADLGIPLGWSPSKADYFIYGDAGQWWEPDFDELCVAMWDVYKNYSKHQERAKWAAGQVAKHWKWSDTVEKFQAIIDPIIAIPFSGSGEWTEPTRRLYPIVCTDRFETEICGRTLIFEPGQEYYESADVKRILFDAGKLDPVCLTSTDHGLAPVQVDQLGKYRADRQFCKTCGQKYNSGLTRADEIFLASEAARGG